jgi:hypothetical protein
MPSRTLSVQITGDSDSLRRAFASAQRSAKEFGVEMDVAEKRLNRAAKNTDSHAKSFDRLNVALGNSPDCVFTTPRPTVSGPGPLQQTVTFTAASSTADAPVIRYITVGTTL